MDNVKFSRNKANLINEYLARKATHRTVIATKEEQFEEKDSGAYEKAEEINT